MLMFAMRLVAEPRDGHSNPQPPAEERTSKGGTSEGMFPLLSAQRQEWARKAVEGYIKKQEQKWQKWDEAMFIPSLDTARDMSGSARQPKGSKTK